VGGQYGVTQGAAFFGESMFHRTPYADQAALVFTHQHLVSRGFALWDTQFWTPHLGRFGCIEMAQSEYLLRLEGALALSAEFA
jgi:leucyl/phenylalanyl-tRNA--protein transferase